MKKEKNIMARIFINPWFGGTVLFGFASIICFFSINSDWGDRHDFNGLFGFLGLGIILGIGAAFCLYKTSGTSTGSGG